MGGVSNRGRGLRPPHDGPSLTSKGGRRDCRASCCCLCWSRARRRARHILYYIILYYAKLYCTKYYDLLYYTIIHYPILYYTILYYTIVYYTILYCTILLLEPRAMARERGRRGCLRLPLRALPYRSPQGSLRLLLFLLDGLLLIACTIPWRGHLEETGSWSKEREVGCNR